MSGPLQIHKKIALARNHTPPYVSLSRRMTQLRAATAESPEMLLKLSQLYDSVHSPARALSSLGLQNHASAADITGYRDPLHMKIIYHADARTIYQREQAWPDLAPPQPPNNAPPTIPDVPDRSEPAAGSGPARPVSGSSGSAASGSSGAPGSSRPHRRMRGKQEDGASAVSAEEAAIMLHLEQGKELIAAAPDELLKKYALQSISSLLEESGSACDAVYSMPFSEEALSSLSWTARSHVDEDPQPVLDWKTFCLSKHVFLQVIRKAVGAIVVPKGTGLRKTDWAVSFLKVNSIKKTAEESFCVAVNSSPLCLHSLDAGAADRTPVVLSLEALPLDSLLRLRRWEHTDQLSYSMTLPEDDGLQLQSLRKATAVRSVLLDNLLQAGAYVIPSNDPLHTEKSQLLEQLERLEFAKQDGEGWLLTPKGHENVQVSTLLQSSDKVFKARDVPFEDMEVIELLLSLRDKGWEHKELASKKALPDGSTYMPGSADKTWYYLASQATLCKDYLVCLLTSEKPVPHLAAAAVYAELLGKPVQQGRRRRAPPLMFLADEDIWVDEAALVPKPESKKRARTSRATRVHAAAALEDAAELEWQGQDEREEDKAGSDDVDMEAEPEAEADGGAAAEEEGLAADVAGGSSSSSSGSSSSSSSDSDDRDGAKSSSSYSGSSSSPGSGRAAAKARAGGTRRRDVAIPYGKCRLTPTKTGYQMTCGHPKHDGGSAACTKTRSCAINGEQTTLRMLKFWAQLGIRSPSKEDHQKACWQTVMKALKDGSLPSMDALDAKPVLKFR